MSGGGALPSDPVFIAVEEKITCVLNKDGGCENCEVQGTMSLQVGPWAAVTMRVLWCGLLLLLLGPVWGCVSVVGVPLAGRCSLHACRRRLAPGMAGIFLCASSPSFLASRPPPPAPPPPLLQIRNEADACLRVSLASGDNAGYQFKTHPNIDKAAYR